MITLSHSNKPPAPPSFYSHFVYSTMNISIVGWDENTIPTALPKTVFTPLFENVYGSIIFLLNILRLPKNMNFSMKFED